MALDDETRLQKIYKKLEGVPDEKWWTEEDYFYTSLGGFTFYVYGSADESGHVEEVGVRVFDCDENELANYEHAPGLSDVFGWLLKSPWERQEAQREKEIERNREKLDDFLDE